MISLGYSIHLVCLLLGALLLQGFIKKMKARLQGRQGPGLLKPYYDLWKLLRKDSVLSEHASWVFRFVPYGVFVFTLTAALFVEPSLFMSLFTVGLQVEAPLTTPFLYANIAASF